MEDSRASELDATAWQDEDAGNINKNEQIISILAGVALVIFGLSRRSFGGVLLALLGAPLLLRGATGHCHTYEALGIDTSTSESIPEAEGARHGIVVEDGITVARPCAEVFAFWRDFENFPKFMDHLKEVTVSDARNSHWVAVGPLGTSVEWDALITDETPDEMIAWRSLPESDVHTTGVVRFTDEGEGTRIEVTLQYDPPGGKLGAIVARLFGEEPGQQIADDLQRFKTIMEER